MAALDRKILNEKMEDIHDKVIKAYFMVVH
jgi:hypothetical protein